MPEHIRSDNGPEFIAAAVQRWIKAVGAKTADIMSGSPRENGYVESVNARLRDELLNGEIFYSLRKPEIIVESRRRYRPPAPEVVVPPHAAWPAALTRPAPPARRPVAPRPTVH